MTTTTKAKKPAPTAAEEAMAVGQEAVQDFIKRSQDAYVKMLGDSKEQVEKLMGSYGDFGDQGKASVDAFSEAGKIYVKGVEDLTAEWFAFSKLVIEGNVAASQEALGAKTLQDAVELQSKQIRKASDDFMSQTAKMGELSAKIVQDSFNPINALMTDAVQKFTKFAA